MVNAAERRVLATFVVVITGLTVGCAGESTAPPPTPDPPNPPPPPDGSVTITMETAGPLPRRDYGVRLGDEATSVPVEGAVTIGGMPEDRYALKLVLPRNCGHSGPDSVWVPSGDTARVPINVACREFSLTGRLLFSGKVHIHNDSGFALLSSLPDGNDVINFGYRGDPFDELAYPTISSDGGVVAYEKNDSIYINDGDALSPRALSSPAGGEGAFPAVSPDGDRVAFTRNGDIFLASVDGSGLQRLTDSDHEDLYPAWHPDGDRIDFARDSAFFWRLYSVSTDGTEVRLLRSDFRNYREPAWSPDGSTLAVLAQETSRYPELWLLEKDGTNPRVISQLDLSAASPAWSPDGALLTYHALPPGSIGQRLFVMDTLGVVLDSFPKSAGSKVFHAVWGPAK